MDIEHKNTAADRVQSPAAAQERHMEEPTPIVMLPQQASLFDYAALDSEIRIVVQQRTVEIKERMRRAAQDIIEIGQRLIEVRAKLGYGQFEQWIKAEFDWTRQTAYRFINVAERFGGCNNLLQLAPSALYLLAAPSTPESARIEALSMPGRVTYSHAQEIAARHKAAEQHAEPLPFTPEPSAYDQPLGPPPWATYDPGDDEDDDGLDSDPIFDPETQQAACKYCYATHSDWGATGEGAYECGRCGHATHEDFLDVTDIPPPEEYDGDEWYTPAEWIDAARALYGGVIDLDPASCEAAQERVQATRYYTEADDGLALPWSGKVWCNPPYSTKLIKEFTARAIDQYESGACEAVLLLVNNCTDAQWFIALATRYPVMFSRGRCNFWHPDRDDFAARQGQALFYLGPDVAEFSVAFDRLAYWPNGGIR